MKSFFWLLGALAFFSMVPMRPVYAYLDPASVSMGVQVVVGAVASALFVIKLYFSKIMNFVKGLGKHSGAAKSGD